MVAGAQPAAAQGSQGRGLQGAGLPHCRDGRRESLRGLPHEEPQAVAADQVEPWAGNQRNESLYEFERRHRDMGRAISIGCLQCEHLPGLEPGVRWRCQGG